VREDSKESLAAAAKATLLPGHPRDSPVKAAPAAKDSRPNQRNRSLPSRSFVIATSARFLITLVCIHDFYLSKNISNFASFGFQRRQK
jgi:hypothetical protein